MTFASSKLKVGDKVQWKQDGIMRHGTITQISDGRHWAYVQMDMKYFVGRHIDFSVETTVRLVDLELVSA